MTCVRRSKVCVASEWFKSQIQTVFKSSSLKPNRRLQFSLSLSLYVRFSSPTTNLHASACVALEIIRHLSKCQSSISMTFYDYPSHLPLVNHSPTDSSRPKIYQFPKEKFMKKILLHDEEELRGNKAMPTFGNISISWNTRTAPIWTNLLPRDWRLENFISLYRMQYPNRSSSNYQYSLGAFTQTRRRRRRRRTIFYDGRFYHVFTHDWVNHCVLTDRFQFYQQIFSSVQLIQTFLVLLFELLHFCCSFNDSCVDF